MDKCEGCPFRGFGSWDEDDDDGIGRHTPGTCLIGHKNNFRAKDCHLDCEQWDAILQAIAGEGRLLLDEKDFTSRDKFALWYMERNPNHFITLAYQFADEALAARQGRGWTITQPLETTETGQDQGGK